LLRTTILCTILLCVCQSFANGQIVHETRRGSDSSVVVDSVVAIIQPVKNVPANNLVPASQVNVGIPQEQNMLGSFLQDEGDMWTSPFRMDWNDAAIAGGVVAATAILIATDEPVYRSVNNFRNDHTWVQKISPVATKFGEFYVPYGVAALFCLKGLAFDDEEAVDTGLLSVQAMIHSAIAVQVFKHLFGRVRPFVLDGKDKWHGPQAFGKRYSDGGFSPYDSFPSGHTITAFSLAAVIAERSDQFWVGATAYSLAGLCGVSRITERDHWLSDVVVGAAMGVAIGKLVVHNHRNRLVITPSISFRSVGVGLQLNY
jgi:membrane-associated phospholipid phosphatase